MAENRPPVPVRGYWGYLPRWPNIPPVGTAIHRIGAMFNSLSWFAARDPDMLEEACAVYRERIEQTYNSFLGILIAPTENTVEQYAMKHEDDAYRVTSAAFYAFLSWKYPYRSAAEDSDNDPDDPAHAPATDAEEAWGFAEHDENHHADFAQFLLYFCNQHESRDPVQVVREAATKIEHFHMLRAKWYTERSTVRDIPEAAWQPNTFVQANIVCRRVLADWLLIKSGAYGEAANDLLEDVALSFMRTSLPVRDARWNAIAQRHIQQHQ